MKTNSKKTDPNSPATPVQPKKNEGLKKGNGTKNSTQPQQGRNPNGKDGARAGILPD